MKLKLLIVLSLFLLAAGAAFGQKTEPAKTAKPDEKTPAKLPAAAEIVARYVKALGGREANEKIKSRVYKGTIEISPMGIKGTTEIYSAAPNKSIAIANIAGIGELKEGFDGTTAWTINPVQGSRDKTGQELLQVKLTADFYRDINLDKLYPKMEVKGIEKVGDKDAYVVVAAPDGVPAESFYFDTVSGLLLRSDSTLISPEGNMAAKNFFEDYRDVDGIKVPFKTRAVMPQFEIVTTLSEVKNNVPVEDSKFAKPKQ